MPYPLLTCDQTEVPEACCNTLYAQGLTVLTAAAGALSECLLPHGCCGRGMRAFVSLGTPELAQTDILAVYLEPPGFLFSPRSFGNSGMFVGNPEMRALWRVYLLESGYPGLKDLGGGQLATPNDDELHLGNEHAYAHGQAILRGLLSSTELTGCGDFALRDMQPVGPTVTFDGWSAGWSIGLTLSIRI